MASLLLKSVERPQIFQLRLGINRIGRSPATDFPIEDATVSAIHCEIKLSEQGLTVRDCNSTNGTFVDGKPISESSLNAGQILQLGDVELLVESTEVKISIPIVEDMPPTSAPRVFPDGSIACPRHDDSPATFRCTACKELMCDACVRRLRRRGGKAHFLCPLCGKECEPLGGKPAAQKKTFFGTLRQTIKLPFVRNKPR